MEVSKLGT